MILCCLTTISFCNETKTDHGRWIEGNANSTQLRGPVSTPVPLWSPIASRLVGLIVAGFVELLSMAMTTSRKMMIALQRSIWSKISTQIRSNSHRPSCMECFHSFLSIIFLPPKIENKPPLKYSRRHHFLAFHKLHDMHQSSSIRQNLIGIWGVVSTDLNWRWISSI